MSISERIRDAGASLTVTERRIADLLLHTPHVAAFGTVAEVADAANAGTATVVRFATKLGYDGFVGLQHDAQQDLAGKLRPAAERIRQLDDADIVDRHIATEEANVAATLTDIDRVALDAVVARLADGDRPVLVMSGAASRGVAWQFVHDLGHVRRDVRLLDGNQVDVMQMLSLTPDDTCIVAIDLRRYDRWLVEALAVASALTLTVFALSDSVLSPLAQSSDHSFVVDAESAGPFDSHVGTLALLNLVVIEVSLARRERATARLDHLEAAWRDADALTD